MRRLMEKLETPAVLKIGMWLLSAMLVLDAFDDLWEIFHFDWYRVMLADTPQWLVCVRYVFSLALRLVMLWAVAGLLTLRHEYRRVVVGLSVFNFLTVALHHPYSSFIYISNYLNLNSDDFMQTAVWFGHRVYPGVVARMLDAWVGEVFLAFLTLAFLMNPKVKRLFQ